MEIIFTIFFLICIIYGFLWVHKQIKLINKRKEYIIRHLKDMTFEKINKVYDGEYDLFLDE